MNADKLFGVMAATELVNPAAYTKAVHGCRRFGCPEWEDRYYAERIEMDVVHGEEWPNNITTPTLI